MPTKVRTLLSAYRLTEQFINQFQLTKTSASEKALTGSASASDSRVRYSTLY